MTLPSIDLRVIVLVALGAASSGAARAQDLFPHRVYGRARPRR